MTKTAQGWLDATYQDKTVGKIELWTKEKGEAEDLTGELVIKDYIRAELINFERWDKNKFKDKITKITIDNCPQVKQIKFNNNEITDIIFQGTFPNLTWLDLPSNKLTKIDVSKFPNLTRLNVARNPNLTEIEGWENLTKLEMVNLLDTPGLNGKKFKEWKDAINSALGSTSQDGSLPNDWKSELDDLKNRPTKDDLNNAVNNAKDKFKEFIDPNDKAKLEQAAKDAGFISPNDLENEAKKKGMVSKEEYDNRPNTTLTDYQKLLNNQKPSNLPDDWESKLNDLKGWEETFKGKKPTDIANQISGLERRPDISITKTEWDTDWSKRPKKSDFDNIKNELDSWKNKFPSKTPDQVAKDLQSGSTTGGDSGTGGALTPEQKQKIDDYYVVASYLRQYKGNTWKNVINEWKEKNQSYIERTKEYLAQIEQAGKK